MIIQKLQKAGAITPPSWLADNVHYLTIMGSESYGCSSGASDIDLYGFCIPPRNVIFPHLSGEIFGFGKQQQRFEQFQQHHIQEPNNGVKEYDIAIYSIVKYFQLLMENNPNMIDSIFTPRRCVIHSTPVGELVRQNRKLFLHKGAMFKLRGYAFAQMSKIKNKQNSSNPRRAADIEAHNFDTKFAYHVVRLCLQCEQILATGDLNLERDREIYKSIRRGEWTLKQIEDWFENKEKSLETLYANSTLPHSPDEDRIKKLLLECLEHHYGSMADAIKMDVTVVDLISEMETILRKYKA
jgi:predicted nucleotidyltransferase